MCGIVGYTGKKEIDSVLIVGLIRLEYRGYDSAGIALIDAGELIVRKERGKIKELEEDLLIKPERGTVGIGHTRWATHGQPSAINAHPHTDCRNQIAVVHNGIIENHLQLRTELIGKGHMFKSDTDSEVIPHLFEEARKNGKEPFDAMKELLSRLEGKFAFSLIHEGEPDRIYFARNGSPLLFGKGIDETFLASDVSAIIPAAKEQYSMNNGEWGWIDRQTMHLFDLEGTALDYKLQEIKLDVKELDKGDFSHFMEKEIYDQPDVLRRIIQERISDQGLFMFPEMKLPNDFQGKITRIMIQSAGTSWHAGLMGKMYLEHFAKVVTEVDVSSEFRYRNPIAEGDTMVIAISQSGETADTLAGIHEAKAKFIKVLSFVNNTQSTIARESDAYIDLMAGAEIGVASTKAYTAQLLTILLYSLNLAGLKWMLTEEQRAKIIEEIRQIPTKVDQILARAKEFQDWAKKLKEARDFVFLGRNFNYPTALEGALKLKEISYVHASGYAGGEFKHGPIALITKDVPVVTVIPKTEVYEKMVSNIEEVRARHGIILSIHTEGDTRVPELSDFSFAIPECPDFLSPILSVIPLQLLSYYMAVERGCEPDQPRNLAKSVTVE